MMPCAELAIYITDKHLGGNVQIIDELTYRLYSNNRIARPDFEAHRYAPLFPNWLELEKEFVRRSLGQCQHETESSWLACDGHPCGETGAVTHLASEQTLCLKDFKVREDA